MPQLTLNIITHNELHNIKPLVGKCREYFDRIIVVDGGSTDGTVEYLQAMDCTVVNRPWDDNYGDSYQAHMDECSEGDWILIMDSDEIPSRPLLLELRNIVARSEDGQKYSMVHLPDILHIDGVPTKKWADIPNAYGPGIFTKPILFRYNYNRLQVSGAHVSVMADGPSIYVPLPYYHMKTAKSFVVNDVLHAFLEPENQGYTKQEADRFKDLLKRMEIENTSDLRHYCDTYFIDDGANHYNALDAEFLDLIKEWYEKYPDNPKSRIWEWMCWTMENEVKQKAEARFTPSIDKLRG